MARDERAPLGVIHGRFQVLHNDHLRYLLAGKAACRRLVVGVTNPDPSLTGADAADPHRHAPEANPLTYYERQELIHATLEEAGVPPREFRVVPFPVNRPELYHYYVPMHALFFLTIYDDWGKRKLALFQELGLKTHVLWERAPQNKGLSSTDIRASMREGRAWEHQVPPAAARLLKEWGIPGRLARG